MKLSRPSDKWSQYLYNHEIPLREHLRRLALLASSSLQRRALILLRDTQYLITHPRETQALAQSWFRRRILTLATALVLVWMFVMYKSEVVAFDKAIDNCRWPSWEQWSNGATPHHLIFVADPQLVDPHTYPGRPWPLSSLGIAQTDVYLRRVYSRLQRTLDPDTIMFLGDLFDGGREWSTRWSQSPEDRYRKYKDSYWMREYNRFSDIFFKEWDSSRHLNTSGHPGRRIIASLPGNHDLGFGQGVQLPVRDRFVSMFGEVNRMDIVGNHTIVSLDTVSLSAKDDGDNLQQNAAIWQPAEAFLNNAEHHRKEAVHRHRRLLLQDSQHDAKWAQHGMRQVHAHKVEDHWQRPLSEPVTLAPAQYLDAEYPGILLTHVPLYRDTGTPCGPLRERHPPSPGAPEVDEPNAISISRGYQYQNVVSREISASIISKLGNRIVHVFSGDDHDYCDLVHHAYQSPIGAVREITVKSISMAMGIRRPGFVMASLWNPVDDNGRQIAQPASPNGDQGRTLQTHLCLLPDEVGNLIDYGLLAGLSLFIMLVRAFLVVFVPSRFGPEARSAGPLLPTYKHLRPSSQSSSAEREKQSASAARQTTGGFGLGDDTPNCKTASSSSTLEVESLSSRSGASSNSSSNGRRSASPLPSYGYGVGSPKPDADAKRPWNASDTSATGASRRARHSKARRLLEEWVRSSAWVVVPVVVWFLWLARTP